MRDKCVLREECVMRDTLKNKIMEEKEMFKRKTKSRLKRALSGALALTMAASVLAVIPVSADNTSHTYFGDGYEVNYSIKSSWDGNQNIEVKLSNTGSEPLLNWALKYNANGEINGLWNGTVYSSDSTKYIVKNAGYNYELLPEQTITFGYTLTGDDLAFPDTIELCSQRTERSNDDYAVTMDVTDDWGTGFNGTITIENMGESALEAWQLSFDTNFVIDDIWNAQTVSSEENHYTVANDVTTTPIGVGESKVFGFRAGKETDTVPEVLSFAMSEMTVNDDFSTIDITDDEEDELLIYAFGKYDPDENVINIEWYTNVQNGSFELMESYNNEDYITTSFLMNTDSYTYPISQDFDTRYFKVKQTSEDGRTAESVPFVVNRSENGYSVGFLDSDGDGLADIYEEIVGTDINKPDTDEDSLTDYQEVYITGTDPTKYDSVTEGVSDADADSDNDGLSNADEIELGTDPNKEDSDGDGLKDGEEVGTYGTDPLKVDTDDDGLEDGDEIYFESDPLNIDSDGNDISDGDEKRSQTFIHEVETEDCAVTEVRVSMEGTGNIQKTTTVESIMGRDVLCSQAVGLVGEPFEIETDSQFDTATITYVIDKSKLGDTEFDKLMFLWYDEANDNFVELDTVLDEENSTASVATEHFSKYLLVDSEAWFLGWKEVYDKIREALSQHTPGATVLISKCSNVNDINKTSCTERIVENVVNSMSGLDILSFMMYQNSSYIYSDFTSDKNQLEWNPLYYSAATTANYGIGMAAYILDDEAAEYKQRIVFITDSSVTVDSRYQNMAIANNIPIYFICISDFNTSILNSYALLTGGRVFEADTIDEIDEVCNNMDDIFNGETDTDHDGFSDIEETMGLLVDSSCNPIKTNYLKLDTDDDCLDDNEEVDVELTKIEIPGKQGNPSTFKYYHHMWSDPTMVDTDGDGYNDDIDFSPLVYDNINGVLFESEHKMGLGYDGESLADDLTKDDYSYDQLRAIDSLFSIQMNGDVENNIADFKIMSKTFFAFGNDADEMIEDLIDKFIYGTDETIEIKTKDGIVEVPVYTNEALYSKVQQDEQVQEYFDFVKSEFVKQLQKSNGDLTQARNNMQNIVENSSKHKIKFARDKSNYLSNGMTISINDLWGSNVSIIDYSYNDGEFSGVLRFSLYDHFGLDQPDVEKIYVNLAGFRAWFVLQHFNLYNGEYEPFINLMEYEVPFSGEI